MIIDKQKMIPQSFKNINLFHNQHKHLLIANRTAFMLIGIIEAAWAPLIPYVKSAFAIDEGTLGLLMLCSGLGAVCSLPVSGWLVSRFGAKKVVQLSGLLMALALLTISLLVNLWLTGCMLLVFGACTITIDVAANVNGIAVEKKTDRHLMSGFHGGYSLGTLIGAGAMSVLFTLGIVPVWAVVMCMAFTLAALVFGCRDLLSREDLANEVTVAKSDGIKLHIPPMVIAVGLLCFVIYATEGAVMGWAAVFVSEERGVEMSQAGFFYTAFAVMMTVVRLSGDTIVERLGRRNVVAVGAALVSLGFIMVIAFTPIAATIIGFAMIGMGSANIVPQLVSFAGSIKGMAVSSIISVVNALGYSGILLGPVVIGFVAKHYGLHTSFAGIATFCLVVAIASWVILKPECPGEKTK